MNREPGRPVAARPFSPLDSAHELTRADAAYSTPMYRSLLALALLVASPTLAQAPTHEGRWVVVDASRAGQARDAAVEDVVEDMNFIARPIARRRLREGLPVHQAIELRREGERLRVKIGSFYELAAPVDDSRHPITDALGTELRARQRWDGHTLIQRYSNEDATVTLKLRFAEDGSTLRLETRIHAERLPSDVVFSVAYRRAS